jgi:AraC family transcriptional regulator
MGIKRLEQRLAGQPEPFGLPPALSSEQSSWCGFPLKRIRCGAGFFESIVRPLTEVILVTSGSVSIEADALGTEKRFFAGPGSITIWPAGHESRFISSRPSALANKVSVQLDLTTLQQLGAYVDSPQINPQLAVRDVTISTLLRLMESDIDAGCPTGRLYGESLCLALTTHLETTYGIRRQEEHRLLEGLSKRQFERVREYIHLNIGGDMGLNELARLEGMSVQHFAAGFRKAVGMTPHQYVLYERVNQARRLLTAQKTPLIDVALSLGFSSQSHFTDVFRRIVGVTPLRYRHTLKDVEESDAKH